MDDRRRTFGAGLLALSAALLVCPRAAPAASTAEGDVAATGPGLVLPVAVDDAWWDTVANSCPRVLRLGPRDFRMWYYGRDASFERAGIRLPSGRIGLARSTDGIRWNRVRGPATRGAVMDPAADPARFDSAHVGIGDIQCDGRGFEMWYFGGDRQSLAQAGEATRGFPLRIGLARSRDGLHWRRHDGPVHGAAFDVGAPGAPDAVSVGWPQVVKERDDLWRLYYHSFGREFGFAICAAESADQGRTWRRLGVLLGRGTAGAFDVAGASTRHVFMHRGRRLMLYEGWGADGRPSIGIAESTDGLDWRRIRGPLPDGAVFAPAPAASGHWDCGAIGTPWFVDLGNGRFHLYYVGRRVTPASGKDNDARYQIGLAISDDPELMRWRRLGEARA
jgi:hypothetical protein